MGYLIQKPSLQMNRSDTFKLIGGEIRGVHAFPKNMSPKVNIIAWLEFELADYNVVVQIVSKCLKEVHPL